MKIALTKTKTIEIKAPKWFSASGSKGLKDVVGVEFASDNPQGFPAVRLVRKGKGFLVAATGFIAPPDGNLPQKWEETPHQPVWEIPPHFQAPHAAFAVISPDMFLRQTTRDVAAAEAAKTNVPDSDSKLSLKKSAASKKSATSSDLKLGTPVSNNGVRSICQALDEKPFVLESGLPEYQVLWLSRLLPEGRRPTVSSIQVHPAAVLSAPLSLPGFVEADGTAFVIYVFKNTTVFAAYRKNAIILYRECPDVAGYEAIRFAVKTKLGLEDSLVDSVMDDTLIDPRPAMEPFVRPILQQVEISMDYLSRRHNLKIDKIFLLGLPSGAAYWSQIAKDALKIPVESPSVFDGLQLSDKANRVLKTTPSQSQMFLAALGAARAAMETD